MTSTQPDPTPTLKPDLDAALAFLRRLKGRVHLVAISPDGGGIEGKLFSPTRADGTRKEPRERADEIRSWIESRNRAKNVYFACNVVAPDFKGPKPTDADIAELRMLKVDLDPLPVPADWSGTAEEWIDRERALILASLTTDLPEHVPGLPSLVLDSGSGLWGMWVFALPAEAEAGDSIRECGEALIEHYRAKLGKDRVDGVADLSRIARLPGTLNHPGERKVKKGRRLALARVVEEASSDQRRYGPVQFLTMEAQLARIEAKKSKRRTGGRSAKAKGSGTTIETLDDLRALDTDARNLDPREKNARNRCKVVIAQGCDPEHPGRFGGAPSLFGIPCGTCWDGDRSDAVFYVCCELIRRGVDDETIRALLLDEGWGISSYILTEKDGRARRDPEAHAQRQIDNAHDKVGEVEVSPAEGGGGEFQKDKDGKPYANLHNARLAIEKLGVALEFDEFAERSQVSGLPDFGPQLDDAAVTRLWLAVEERFKIMFGKERFVSIVSDAARRNRRHPVREFLDGLSWDGTPRLDGWLSSYLGVEDSEYTRAVGTLVLVAAVRRVRRPGCKFDEMVVLEGPQGSNKSTALKELAVFEDWFSDDLPLNAKAQQFIEQTVGKWIVEAGELKGMRKGDVDALKSCLSRQRDRARMAWGRLPLERARQFVIIGTTNSERYLKDGTGGRRFWPVRVGQVQLDDLRRDREQLWAEAAARESAGASIRLDPALYGAAGEQQEARRIEDPWVQVLGDALEGVEGKLRTEDAWVAVGVTSDRRTQHDNERLGEAMRELGWERVKLRFGGSGPEWCYAKGDAQARSQPLAVMYDGREHRYRVRPADERSADDEAFG